MMKKCKKSIKAVSAALFVAGVLSLTGCGRAEDDSEQVDTAAPYEMAEAESKTEQESRAVQTDADTIPAQDDTQEQDGETGSGIDDNSQVWTQEKIDEAERRDRAALEEKIKAAGGISEDEAIEIARKAMEADIGEKAKELEVCIWPDLASKGWKLSLFDITDWDEYKDKGDIAYSVDFVNKDEVTDPEDFFNYKCFVNAVDGSICGAYSLSGDVTPGWDIDDLVWYEH